MSAAHTKGPWVVHPLRLNQVCTADGLEVACATILHPAKATVDNARLIAAAPELLRVAEMLVEALADGSDSLVFGVKLGVAHGFARAAIAKATGSGA